MFDIQQSIVHGIVTKIKHEPEILRNKTRTEKKITLCHICEGTFSTKRGLKMHTESIHKGKKQYKCDIQ